MSVSLTLVDTGDCVMSSHSGSVSVTTLGDTGGAVIAVTVALSGSVTLTETLVTAVTAVTVLCQVSVTLDRDTGDCVIAVTVALSVSLHL